MDDEPIDALLRTRAEDPLEARRVAAVVESRLFGGPPRPRIALGRYVVLKRLGAGGGGIVHAAYDPELDRKVAIKLLHAGGAGTDGSSRSRTRLLREAQAMARLAHPNIIAVYDVGTFEAEAAFDLIPEGDRPTGNDDREDDDGEDVYVVMELVRGPSLSEWFAEKRRPWREVLAVMLQAAKGLAAAHKAGLVHRDFKPSNVIVGDDGRVRVLDFGLVSASQDRAPGASSSGLSGAPSASTSDSISKLGVNPTEAALDTPVTFEGAVVGTPAYMAPEQHRGDETDERTDQYALCVSLFEGLHGTRPFSGSTLPELQRAKEDKAFAKRDASVPRWLDELILRGLEPDPARRHPSMAALIAGLQHDRGRRLRRLLIAGAAVAGLSAASYGVYASQQAKTQHCEREAKALAGAWNEDAKPKVRAAFEKTGRDYATTVWSTVDRLLTRYADEWGNARATSCLAATVTGTQTMADMSAQMLCLDRGRARFEGLLESFGAANEKVVETAVPAVSSLRSPNDCLSLTTEEAVDPARAKQLLEVERAVAAMDGDIRAARFDDARVRADETVERARALGDDTGLARAYSGLSRLDSAEGDYAASEISGKQALYAAERAGDRDLALSALLRVTLVVGVHLARYEEGMHLADLTQAKLAGQSGHERRRARLIYYRGRLQVVDGRYADAEASFVEALEVANAAPRPDRYLIAAIHNLQGVTLDRRGRYRDALESYRLAWEMRREIFGDDHPYTMNSFGNMAIMRSYAGEYEASEGELAQAVVLMNKGYGPGHPRTAWFISEHAEVLRKLDRLEEALELERKALAIRIQRLGPQHPSTASSRRSVAVVLNALGQPAEALELVDATLAAWDEPDGQRSLPRHLVVRARSLRKLGRTPEARRDLDRALALAEGGYGSEHPVTRQVLSELGAALLDQRQPGEAIVVLERARGICDASELPPIECAPTWFLLARALVESDRDVRQGVQLANRALAEHQRRGLHAKQADEIAAWLDARNPEG